MAFPKVCLKQGELRRVLGGTEWGGSRAGECEMCTARTQAPMVGVSTLAEAVHCDEGGRGLWEPSCSQNLFGHELQARRCVFRWSPGDGRLDSKPDLASSSVLGGLRLQTRVLGARGSLFHTHLLSAHLRVSTVNALN